MPDNLQIPIRIKEKPWGREIWFAETASYAGKVLIVKKGHRYSLQYHEKKFESQYIYKGQVKITVGNDMNSLQEIILNAGDKIDVYPYTIHRLEALTDAEVFEVSTRDLNDVIKLADDYGRTGKGNNEELDKKLHDQTTG
jgi:mannose-6-phosphate isomerase